LQRANALPDEVRERLSAAAGDTELLFAFRLEAS
jgi:hypothetical protein